MLFYYWGLFTDAKLFTLEYIVPLLQDVKVLFNLTAQVQYKL